MAVTRETLELRFGASNIFMWADLENTKDEVEVDKRIEAAIEWATADLDSLVNQELPSNTVVDDVVARKAAMWLYDSRGIGPEDTLSHHRTYVDQWVNRYNSGRINFSLPTAPIVVNDETDQRCY